MEQLTHPDAQVSAPEQQRIDPQDIEPVFSQEVTHA